MIPEDATSVSIGFGPSVYISWPSLEVIQEGAGHAWVTWDVWDRRGHLQGAHRLQSGISFDRACEVARRAMDLTPVGARDAFMIEDVLEREKREPPSDPRLDRLAEKVKGP
jgi:hypothetical protein